MNQAYLHRENMEDVRERLENSVTQSSVETMYDGEDCFITVTQKNYETGNESKWSFCVDFGTGKVQMLEPTEDEESFTSDNEVFRIIKNFLNGGSSREKRMSRPDYDSGEPIKITGFGNKIGSSKKLIKSSKYIVEVGNDEIKFDNIEEANETFRQAVENNDANTSIKIYVDEGYSNKHLKLMRSERGRLTSSRKPIKSSSDLFSDDFFNGKIKLSLEVCDTPLNSKSYKYINNGKIYFYAVTINGKPTEIPNVSVAYLPSGREPIYFNDDIICTDNLPNEVYVENTFSPEIGISLTINSNIDFTYDYISSTESYQIKNLSVPEGGFLIKEYGRETSNGRAIFDYFKLVALNRGNDKVFLRMIVDYVARHMSRPSTAKIVVNTLNPMVSFNSQEVDVFDTRAIVKATIQFKKGSLSKIISSSSRKPIKSDYSDEEYWYPETKKVYRLYKYNSNGDYYTWDYDTLEEAQRMKPRGNRYTSYNIKEVEVPVQSSRKLIKSDFNPYYEKHPDTFVAYLVGDKDSITQEDIDKAEKEWYKLMYAGYGSLYGETGHLFLGPYENVKSYVEDYLGVGLLDDYLYTYDKDDSVLDHFETQPDKPLPTEKDYRDFVNQLNKYVAENYETHGNYGPIYKFDMYKGEGTNSDGYGHEYPNFIIYDDEGNLDMHSDDDIVEYIRKILDEKGWYAEPVSAADNFTIAIK